MLTDNNRILRYGVALVFLLLWTASGAEIPKPQRFGAELNYAIDLWSPYR
jgi:hypothetical protein